MAMSIRTNVGSLAAQRNLFNSQSTLADSFNKLSSGMRITKAGDDAAGLGISNNLEAQIKSYGQANRNAQDALSVLQTAEGALNQTSELLARLRELAMQSASAGVGSTERSYIGKEATALTAEIDRISKTTEFNDTKLLDGSATSLSFQVGIRASADDHIDITTLATGADTTTLWAGGTFDLTTSDTTARSSLSTIDSAIITVSGMRAELGSSGNRFASVVQTIQTAHENISAANSRIRDVDVAEETSRMARTQVMMQAGVSVLAQANQAPQVALKLLG